MSSPQRLTATGPVLVIDDDRGVRRVLRRMLEHGGYRVQEAVNGLEALEVIRVLNPPPAVVITELSLRILDGAVVAQTLNLCRPDIPVICTSGGPTLTSPPVDCPVLRKPFPSELLLEQVSRAVAQARGLRVLQGGLAAAPAPWRAVGAPSRHRALQAYVRSGDLLAAAHVLASVVGG